MDIESTGGRCRRKLLSLYQQSYHVRDDYVRRTTELVRETKESVQFLSMLRFGTRVLPERRALEARDCCIRLVEYGGMWFNLAAVRRNAFLHSWFTLVDV